MPSAPLDERGAAIRCTASAMSVRHGERVTVSGTGDLVGDRDDRAGTPAGRADADPCPPVLARRRVRRDDQRRGATMTTLTAPTAPSGRRRAVTDGLRSRSCCAPSCACSSASRWPCSGASRSRSCCWSCSGSRPRHKPQHSLGNVKFIVAYTPVVMVFSLTILALNALPPALAAYREKGYLRRLSTTPVGAWRLLTAEVAINFARERRRRGAGRGDRPHRLLRAAPAASSAGSCWRSCSGPPRCSGSARSCRRSRRRRGSPGIVGSLLFFPMMFFAGLWVPRAEMGSVLRGISDYTPLGALVAAVQRTTGRPLAGHDRTCWCWPRWARDHVRGRG